MAMNHVHIPVSLEKLERARLLRRYMAKPNESPDYLALIDELNSYSIISVATPEQLRFLAHGALYRRGRRISIHRSVVDANTAEEMHRYAFAMRLRVVAI